jgi:hypothetical protein
MSLHCRGLRKGTTFGQNRDTVREGLRKMYNEDLHLVNEDEIGKEYSTNGQKRKAYRTLI